MCELTILMPCLNEAETLGTCIQKAFKFLHDNDVSGEVLIADNGSTDGSIDIAINLGARVISVEQRGYGSALIAGTNAAHGKYIIMGDADDSYDFVNLHPFLLKLQEGYDLVMGNRFAGGIEKGAMPWSHQYIGNPILSYIGRVFYKSNIKDFHCGLRGYHTEAIKNLHLKTTGMEYASEMVVMSELHGLRIAEVPTTLKKDGRSRRPHLRSFKDGWRHLKFLFMYCPDWLFLYPGVTLCVIGLLGGVLIELFGNVEIGEVAFGVHTLLYMAFFIIIGVKIIFLYTFTKVYARNSHFLVKCQKADLIEQFSVDFGIFGGAIFVIVGSVLTIIAFVIWSQKDYGALFPESFMRLTIPAAVLIALGIEFIFSSFFIGILDLNKQESSGGD
ncbi:MAG: glycosyltransferase family 2 protein [Acetatifactor sp.]|nr:glycosyltransferase family 2 protein [Acetatifactor sp.]